MRPWWLRPPDLLCFSTSAACGAPLCRSGVTTRTAERRPAEEGLNFINCMGSPSGLRGHVDALAGGQALVSITPVDTATGTEAEGLVLYLLVDDVDRLGVDVEQLRRGGVDVGLGGDVRSFVHVLVAHILQANGLLGHARREQYAENF